MSDAGFIVDVRAPAGRFLNHGAATIAEQREWLEAYFDRPGDFYFVVESANGDRPEGLVGLYAMDARERTAEWGRWVIRPGSSAAVESALLIYRCAFECLALERVWCRTLADNDKVLAFHDACGLMRAPEPLTLEHNGRRVPGVLHALSRQEWALVRSRLEPLAARVARTLGRSSRVTSPL